jgi:hypothetical protein
MSSRLTSYVKILEKIIIRHFFVSETFLNGLFPACTTLSFYRRFCFLPLKTTKIRKQDLPSSALLRSAKALKCRSFN